MASLLSFSLNLFPLYNPPKTLFQGAPTPRLAGRRLQNPITSTKEIQLNWSNSLNRGSSAVNRSYFITVTHSRNPFLPFSNHVDVSSSSYVLISGFWVGPDTDDGWGFVEALVHRI